MAEVGNLDTCVGVTLIYFYNGKCMQFIKKKITDPTTIMIRVAELMVRYF